jgi:hypothetical protein
VVAYVVSRLFAFSTAHFSYSSQSFAVFPGMHGGGRGSLNGDFFLASEDDWFEANVMMVDDILASVLGCDIRTASKKGVGRMTS